MSIDVSRVKLPPKLRMDCYRTALYPILHYYGCDADLLLIAEGVLLQYNEKLTCAAIPFFSDEDLLEDFDIDQTFLRFDRKEEVVPSLTRALDKGFFAVCLLDIYYYSLFRSVYQKNHTVHGFPVYGYDDEKRIFHAIDADYLESFERTFVQVPYEDIANGVIGYTKLREMPGMQVLKRDHAEPAGSSHMRSIREKYVKKYIESLRGNNGTFCSSEMDNFLQYLSDSALSEDEMVNFSIQTYKYIDQFINARMQEYYSLPDFFRDVTRLQELDMSIVEKSNYVRSIMYRTLYTREYRRRSFEKFPDIFKNILSSEKERADFISTFPWENNFKERGEG